MNMPVSHHERRFIGTLERVLFSRRPLVLLVFLLASLVLAWQAVQIRPDASFSKMIPLKHPFILNYLRFEDMLRPQSNLLRVIVENPRGTVFEKGFMERLREVNDAIFYLPGVDRGNLKSLWTPNVFWQEVTSDGLRAGRIIPDGYDGAAASLEQVRSNVARAGLVGSLVANDERSAIILVPLLEVDPQTGRQLDYASFSHALEAKVREHFDGADSHIRVVGFAQIIGDLISGAGVILLLFCATLALISVLIYLYCRCWRSTLVTIATCLLTVVWQLGLLRLLGVGLDPYSILVPFLIFSIATSHAVQNINLMASEMATGATRLEAARKNFSILFIPGSMALIADGIGFATLLIIDIGVIRQLALSASLGVAVALLTKMLLLPVLMSYVGVSPRGLARQRLRDASPRPLWRLVSRVVRPRPALLCVLVSAGLLAGSMYLARDLQIGDLDRGAPEFRATARYNLDNAYLLQHYSTSTDVLVVLLHTPAEQCARFAAADLASLLEQRLRQVPGVTRTDSLYQRMRQAILARNEANPKWDELSRDRFVMNAARSSVSSEFASSDCSSVPISVFLADHKATTLAGLVKAIEAFNAEYQLPEHELLIAGGNAGVEAATNQVIEVANHRMLALVLGIVALMVWWEFRSLRVTLSLVLPLYLSAILCEALMARMGMGVKVATLPVIALGVGIGVDYGIYLYSRLDAFLKRGLPLEQAYFETLRSTGTAVAFTGFTLALGVATWVFSSIRFQADMGLLLTLLFLWNMLGALLLLPALVALLSRVSLLNRKVRAGEKESLTMVR
ncbi:efflux RND transporter permease subunit [Pseudomonas pseudonitroreducens]|uniref:efflux RND transporter permease subunit n=1 Tax=Pseudomonas pseudonitroreducens TaxID=2892326 RepID=UPI001F19809F|nr:MMPL family transporter [Pseudomonas pseudonitroreducens]